MPEIVPDPIDPVENTTPESTPGTPTETPTVQPSDVPTSTEDNTDDDEWGNAADETFPGLKQADQDTNDQKDESETTTQTATDANENANVASEVNPGATLNPLSIRAAQRQMAEEVATVEADVVEKLFPDLRTELVDQDGDPIRSADDLLKLINPATEEPFTPEEARVAFIEYQGIFNQQLAAVQQEIKTIAEVNVTLKDEADAMLSKYSEVLKANPELQQRVWAQYEKTLTKDPKSGVILRAPVSLAEFYDVALSPYAQASQVQQQALEAKAQAETQRLEAEKKAEELKKKQTRSERSDIYGGSQVDTTSPEDKEWMEAIKSNFGDKIK